MSPLTTSTPGSRRQKPPAREIDPPAFGQQCRRAGYDPVDAVERQTRLAAEHDGITGGEAHGARRVAALGPANPKQAGVAERERNDGRLEVVLVTVLMQSHLRRRPVIVDEAAFSGVGIACE